MISCCLTYTIDFRKIKEVEDYCRKWFEIIEKYGGLNNGVFLPSEGACDIALWIFTFPSFAAYERYRVAIETDPEVHEAWKWAEGIGSWSRFDRTFFRPMEPIATMPPTRECLPDYKQ